MKKQDKKLIQLLSTKELADLSRQTNFITKNQSSFKNIKEGQLLLSNLKEQDEICKQTKIDFQKTSEQLHHKRKVLFKLFNQHITAVETQFNLAHPFLTAIHEKCSLGSTIEKKTIQALWFYNQLAFFPEINQWIQSQPIHKTNLNKAHILRAEVGKLQETTAHLKRKNTTCINRRNLLGEKTKLWMAQYYKSTEIKVNN